MAAGRKPLPAEEKKSFFTFSAHIEDTPENREIVNKAIEQAQGTTKGYKVINILRDFIR